MEDGLVRLFLAKTVNPDWVLILVVMEDGLVLTELTDEAWKQMQVLILVVMEDGLVLLKKGKTIQVEGVLILVVMEDGLVQ